MGNKLDLDLFNDFDLQVLNVREILITVLTYQNWRPKFGLHLYPTEH